MPGKLSLVTPIRTGRRVGLVVAFGLAASVVAIPAWSGALQAQLISVPMEDNRRLPITVHGAFGYLLAQQRADGPSGTTWSFGDAFQYRIGADLALRSGAVGITGTLATVPMQRGASGAPDGEMQLRQLFLTFRSPDSDGFGQIIELSTGLSQWANYSGSDVVTGDDAAARNAFAIGLSYGFAVPLGRRVRVTLVQDYITAIGSKTGLPSGARRAQEIYTTRLGLRWRASGATR